MMEKREKIGVVGAGAWGTALALVAARAGNQVILWARQPEVAKVMEKSRENSRLLAGIPLPGEIKITANLQMLAPCRYLFLAVPTQHTREILKSIKEFIKPNQVVIICSKGIEQETGMLLSEVVEELLPEQKFAILSGPNFAREVALGLPAATVIASRNEAEIQQIMKVLNIPSFRLYGAKDIISVQIGGAVKNVIAIACGIAQGLNLGENAKAALITRGLAEIKRLAAAKGGDPATVSGLSGLGDLVLTAGSLQSRNMSLGWALGQGKSLDEIINSRITVAEGIPSALSVVCLGACLKVEMPITETVYGIISGALPIKTGLQTLLSRPFIFE